MEKVKAGTITECFSFSRALHLMRYSKAKVRHALWAEGVYIVIKEGRICKENGVYEMFISTDDILENWTLYDESVHGIK